MENLFSGEIFFYKNTYKNAGGSGAAEPRENFDNSQSIFRFLKVIFELNISVRKLTLL